MVNRQWSTILMSSLFMAASAILPPDGGTGMGDNTPTPENKAARARFAYDRFGIFLHWGLYSMFGQGEWYMTNQDIDCHEYAKAANAFYPHDFNAEEWVSAIANSGAKYITFTTRQIGRAHV